MVKVFAAVEPFIFWFCEYKHITLANYWLEYLLVCFSGWITIDILCILLVLLNRDKSEKRNNKSRKIVSEIIAVLSVCTIMPAFFISLFSVSATYYTHRDWQAGALPLS